MKYVIGIDEVGRGSLAGPVVVAAVLVAGSWGLVTGRPKGKLRDSKKLSTKRRETWFKYFKVHPKISYAVARVYPKIIDRINISRAANLAAFRAFGRLIENCKLKIENCSVFLDGGLYLANSKWQRVNSQAQTIVRGDQKIRAIAMASILAKVTRDRAMVRLAKKYPQYGFDAHKGYGTKKHIAAVKKHGPSKVHRLTFLKKFKKD